MKQTKNYQLPQWEESDRIMMKDFNGAMEKIDTALGDTPKIVYGTYTGDGEAVRKVDLPFTPKVLYVGDTQGATQTGTSPTLYHGGLAFPGVPVKVSTLNLVEIVDNGFQVAYQSSNIPSWQYATPYANAKGATYRYFAIS